MVKACVGVAAQINAKEKHTPRHLYPNDLQCRGGPTKPYHRTHRSHARRGPTYKDVWMACSPKNPCSSASKRDDARKLNPRKALFSACSPCSPTVLTEPHGERSKHQKPSPRKYAFPHEHVAPVLCTQPSFFLIDSSCGKLGLWAAKSKQEQVRASTSITDPARNRYSDDLRSLPSGTSLSPGESRCFGGGKGATNQYIRRIAAKSIRPPTRKQTLERPLRRDPKT